MSTTDHTIPSEQEIAALDLGALLSLRAWLVSLTGNSPATFLTTYEEILADTLAVAALLAGRKRHAETLPPEPAWVAEVEEIDEEGFDKLDDPEVEYRILQLINIGKTNEEVWDILKTEFTLKDANEQNT